MLSLAGENSALAPDVVTAMPGRADGLLVLRVMLHVSASHKALARGPSWN